MHAVHAASVGFLATAMSEIMAVLCKEKGSYQHREEQACQGRRWSESNPPSITGRLHTTHGAPQ